MIEDNALNFDVINNIESELARFKPSYQLQFWKEKAAVLYEWSTVMRNPYFQLSKTVRKCRGMYGLVSHKELEEAGFTTEQLEHLTSLLVKYLGTTDHPSIQLAGILKSVESAYFAVGQDFSLFFPRLRKICGEGQPVTLYSWYSTAHSGTMGKPSPLNCGFYSRLTVSFGI